MSRIYDEIFNEGYEIGLKKGFQKGLKLAQEENRRKVISKLFELGKSLQEINKVFPEIDEDRIKQYLAEAES